MRPSAESPPSTGRSDRCPPPPARCGSATTPPWSAGPRAAWCWPPTPSSAGVHADLALVALDDLGLEGGGRRRQRHRGHGGRPLPRPGHLCGPPGHRPRRPGRGVAEAVGRLGLPGGGGRPVRRPPGGGGGGGDRRARGRPGRRSPVRGARPGDRLFVTGPLGASAAGAADCCGPAAGTGGAGPGGRGWSAAHRRPRARLAEGAAARRGRGHGHDRRLRRAGPRPAPAGRRLGGGLRPRRRAGGPGATADEALGGGEDYELVVRRARRPSGWRRPSPAPGCGRPLVIGRCTADVGRAACCGGEPLGRLGWEHTAGADGHGPGRSARRWAPGGGAW